VSAADTINLQRVSDGLVVFVYECVQVGENGPDIHQCWSEHQMAHTIVACFCLTQKLLPSMGEICAVFFIFQQCHAPAAAHWACETINLLERQTPAFFHQTFGHPTAQIRTDLTTKYGEKCSSRSTNSGVASYGVLGYVPTSTSNNFIFSSLWSKSDSQLSKCCVVCKISWCRCQQLTDLS